MKHIRWHSFRRRVLTDSHGLRFGVFWVRGQSTWLHLPGLVIRLKGPG